MKTLHFIIFLQTVSLAFGGRLEKSFEELQKGNYYNAYQGFLKDKNIRPSGACFGLAKLFMLERSAFFNIDSAFYYIYNCQILFPKEEEAEKKKLALINIHEASIRTLRDLVDAKAFEAAVAKNTLEGFQRYIDLYKTSYYIPEAKTRRNKLAFQEASQINTHVAYENFFLNYPDAQEVPEAKKRFEKLLFLYETRERTPDAYAAFVVKFPGSPYRVQAEDSVFRFYRRVNKPSDYRDFIKKFPKHPKVDSAWEKLYQLSVPVWEEKEVLAFIKANPKYPGKDTVLRELAQNQGEWLPARSQQKWGFIDSTGKTVLPFDYEFVGEFSEGMAQVGLNGKTGFINRCGRLVIPCHFDEVTDFEKGWALAIKDSVAGAINRFGETVLPFIYRSLGVFKEGFSLAERDGLFSFINRSGRWISPFVFDDADDFSNGLAMVGKNGKYGFIDSTGKVTISPEFDWAESMNRGFARISLNGLYGVVSALGKQVIACEYERIEPMQEGLFMVIKGGKFGFADTLGKIIIPVKFDPGPNPWKGFSGGYMKHYSKGRYGLMGKTGKQWMSPEFDDIKEGGENLWPVFKNGKWGYLSNKKKVTILPVYQEAGIFYEGRAWVKKFPGKNPKPESVDRYGYIDHAGKMVISVQFDSTGNFHNGWAEVKLEGKTGILGINGQYILPCLYDDIKVVKSTMIRYEKEGKLGWFNRKTLKTVWEEVNN